MPVSKQEKNFQQNSNCCSNFFNPAYCGVLFFTTFAQQKFYMGRGDKKTKKGKTFKGSFGKSRPASKKKITGNVPVKKEG